MPGHSFMALHLDRGWQWKERNPSVEILSETSNISADSSRQWSDTNVFPSEIHVELLHAGRIPDPYVGFNEHLVQWVGEREWLYRCSFPFDADEERTNVALEFDGLDTFCDVYLNDRLVLSAQNMFHPYTVHLEPNQLKPTDNALLLHFKSAKVIAKELEATFGRSRAGSMNVGDPSRLHVRKAQYDWRWDWGPELMTTGPHLPIRLVTYGARIATLHVPATLVLSADGAGLVPTLQVRATVAGHAGKIERARVALFKKDGKAVREEEVKISFGSTEAHVKQDGKTEEDDTDGTEVVKWQFEEGDVDLWWPNGYGAQTLYTVNVTLLDKAGEILDSQTKRVGFRRVELVQEPLAEPDKYGTGTTFLFAVNGVHIFMGGSNWIPADNFLTTISPARYRATLALLAAGNQNMVRVWGGGVYEPDAFYDACDELGLLVWQDFQFACGVYPAHAAFVAEVREEARLVVRRLRHHACLALFCGNNEDYQQLTQWPDVPELPARVLYEGVLPDVVGALTRGAPVPYHPGSPYGGRDPGGSDPTVGDVHQWDVWGGRERPWQEYDRMGGRFVSEFGIPSMPDIRTVDWWLEGDKAQRRPGSRLLTQHSRAGQAERRFAVALNENCRSTDDLETYVYNTQMVQADAMAYAYRSWRREWRGPGKRYTGGVLVWQSNDCWPVTSWAIIDYFLRPKPAYYAIARELAPFTIGISRTVAKDRPSDRPRQFYEFGAFRSLDATLDVWATNGTLRLRDGLTLELTFVDLASAWTHRTSHPVALDSNRTTEVVAGMPCPGPRQAPLSYPPGTSPSATVVVGARLLDAEGVVLARAAEWPQPLAHVDAPDPELVVSRNGEELTLRVARPVKGLMLSALPPTSSAAVKPAWTGAAWAKDGVWDAGDGVGEVQWSDNALDVMPGDERVVGAKGLGTRRVCAAWMGHERAVVLDES